VKRVHIKLPMVLPLSNGAPGWFSICVEKFAIALLARADREIETRAGARSGHNESRRPMPAKANERRRAQNSLCNKKTVTSGNLTHKVFRFRRNSKMRSQFHSFTASQGGGGPLLVVRTGHMPDILNRGNADSATNGIFVPLTSSLQHPGLIFCKPDSRSEIVRVLGGRQRVVHAGPPDVEGG
jgi:hypothetical protein